MTGEIIFTGTELLLGQIINTNAQFIQQELAALGIDLYYQITVGDNLQRCASAIRQAAGRAELVLVGGGLGPTEDDISREALAEALGLELKHDKGALDIVRRFFDQRGLSISENNLKQALVPGGAMVVDNPIGTAPGIILEKQGKIYILLPGPPNEFIMMVKDRILPYLRDKLSGRQEVIKSKVLKFCGIGESLLDHKLGELLKGSNPTLAPTAKYSEVHLRITAKDKSPAQAEKLISDMEVKVRELLGTYIFGVDVDTLPAVVANLLVEQGLTLATLEDFSGGQLAYNFSPGTGVNSVYKAGIVLKDWKKEGRESFAWIGVLPADSGELALHLASSLRVRFGSQMAVALVSGKGAGQAEDIASGQTFYIAADIRGHKMVRDILIHGQGEDVARRAAAMAMVLLWRYLKHGIRF